MSHINFPDTNQEFLSELFSENGVPPPPSLPTAVEAALGLGCQHMRGPKSLFEQLYLDSRIST